MSIAKIALGTLLVLGGTVATHVLYAMNEDGNLGSTELLIGVLIASIVATAVFCACRRILSSRRARIVTGISVIYLTWLVILLAENPESRMWLPVIVIFGIPFTAPVLIATWFASGLFVSPVVPLQAVGSDQPKR